MMYAPFQPATNYWRAAEVEEVIHYGLPTGEGLDLGCGDGHLMEVILEYTGDRALAGLDVDPKEIQLAKIRKIYRQALTGPGHHIPFASATFDFVFSNSVLEHIENIDEVLREVARVLRPGGRFLFTVPGPDFHSCLRGPRFGDRQAYLRETDARCAHLRYWAPAQWRDHLEGAGLIHSHHHEYLTEAQVRRWEWIARSTSGVLYRATRQKKQPIEIQRIMKVRAIGARLPRFIAALLARVMDLGAAEGGSKFGCLLLEARKGESLAMTEAGKVISKS
jgi:SAM-dependent methyltransferase